MTQPTAVLAPERYRILSGSALKVIAIVTMFIDHASKRLLATNPLYARPLFMLGKNPVNWLLVFETIGRLAFPIFCFLLVEGFIFTRSRRRYALNLLVFALISEIPFDLSRSLTPFDPTYQNVFFTLLIGFLGMCAFEDLANRRCLQAICVIGLALVSMGLLCDYGPRGYALILILYLLRQNALAKTALGCCVTTTTWRTGLAFIPINLYNGQRGFIRGPVLKYAFYAFYPAHILLLWWLRLQMGV